jgi:O-antigen/teichoic acid export membrane protein
MSPLAQTAVYAAGALLSRAAPLLTLPLLTHGLSPADYGRLEMLAMIAEIGGMLAGGGLAAGVFRFAAGADPAERRREGARALGLALALTATALAASLAAAPLLAPRLPVPVPTDELRLAALGFALAACIETPLALLRVEGRALRLTLLTLARLGLHVALLWAALSAGLGVTGALAAGAAASAALALALVAGAGRDAGIALPRGTDLRRHLSFAGPVMAAGLATLAWTTADRWMAAGFGAESLAVYALAIKAALFVKLAVRPYEMWWEGARMRLAAGPDGPAALGRAAAFGAALSLAAGAGMALLGPHLLRLVTPQAYHGAAALLPLAALAGAAHAAGAFAEAGLFLRRTGYALLGANLATAAAALALYAALIPVWGLEGALIARAAAFALRIALFLSIGRALAPALPWARLAALVGLTLGLAAAFAGAGPAAGVAAAAVAALAPFALGLGPRRTETPS